MVLLYYDPIFLEHDTGRHPENAGRLTAIRQRLDKASWFDRCEQATWEPCPRSLVQRVHSEEYLRGVEDSCRGGGGRIEADTVVSGRSFEAAMLAAGAVVDAVRRLMESPNRALCLVRPPGHHARPAAAMGFCLLSNVAIGARRAIDQLGAGRVLIVDWDVHHGNGTQEIFWEDPAVGFFSMHRWPFYPGTGASDEVGSGAGRGMTCNLPIEMGTPRADIIAQFAETLDRFAAKVRPDLVMISAGFDAHRLDPIGSLGLESEDFTTLTHLVSEIANRYAQGRIVSVLEGGYHPAALAESVELHLSEMMAGNYDK